MTPRVSVVVPVYNVERYLPSCLESLIGQTLRDIEIIIVNDGSTDGSLSIIKEYASRDDRIVVIDKENGGYGHSMNRGFEKARGEYIGIVESDDCARPTMFQRLYEQGSRHDADVVRSNYFTMSNDGSTFGLIDVLSLSHAPYYTAFNPQDYPDILRGSPAIWTGIYKRSFLEENNVSFLETPGASYQDTGFMLKVWGAANRAVIMREAFLNYRIDNANSSVKSGAKVFCVCDEYESFEEFLSARPERSEAFRKMVVAKKYETYLWNYNRLDNALKPEFLEKMTEEFSEAEEKNALDQSLFSPVEWNELQAVISNPEALSGKALTVVPPALDPGEHEKTRYANGEITFFQLLAWKIKHALRS
ncbi:glycosyltransferase [Adlercreutzia sp. ZJ473]|uniref:glycosyltransferase n=1 Tax=Adlercreutzia sp. ZJ473 TaxID=2722822 RepID=UPI0015519566|nr:glycosyltransferase [Adlercreutzia sp. ZJ473]